MSGNPPAKHVLITGATGYLGARLVDRIATDWPGFYLSALLHKSQGPAAARVEWLQLDEVIDRGPYDVVVHLATQYGRSGTDAVAVVATNLVLPARLLSSGVCDGGFFLNVGTGLPRHLTPYSLSKHQFVEWLQLHSASRGIRSVNAVLQHFYGPGDSTDKFPTWLMREMTDNAQAVSLTHGRQRRDFIFISDVIDALMEILRGADSFPSHQVTDVPVGTGNAIPVRVFCEEMRSVTGASTELRFGERSTRAGEPDVLASTPGWLEARGWSPQVSLRDGLSRMLAGDAR